MRPAGPAVSLSGRLSRPQFLRLPVRGRALRTPGGPFPPPLCLGAPVGLHGRLLLRSARVDPPWGQGRAAAPAGGGGGLSRAGKFLWAADQNLQQTNIPFKWGKFSVMPPLPSLSRSACEARHPPLPPGPDGVLTSAAGVFLTRAEFFHSMSFLSEEDPGVVRSPEGFAVDVTPPPDFSVESVHSQQRGFWIPSALERSPLSVLTPQ